METISLPKFMEMHFKEFEPNAYYDKHLDCIRVQLKDCSFYEERLNKIFTILKENHVDVEPVVGFNIKGIRYIFEQVGLPARGVYTLTEIINAILKVYPDGAVKYVKEKFGKSIETITVELDNVPAEAI